MMLRGRVRFRVGVHNLSYSEISLKIKGAIEAIDFNVTSLEDDLMLTPDEVSGIHHGLSLLESLIGRDKDG